MGELLAIVIIFGLFGCLVLFATKLKPHKSKFDSKIEGSILEAKTHKNSIFGPVTFMIAILLLGWSIVCFLGGPDAEKGLRPIAYGTIFLVISIVIGYKSVK